MNATQSLQALGQSLWLDKISREMLDDGTLARYIDEFHITGLTSNPTIFEQALTGKGTSYDAAIREAASPGRSGEEVFFDLALQDLCRAADLFRPIFDATHGRDGWVSLEVSPLLVNDAAGTIAAAAELHARAARPNLFIKIPGTTAGIEAIEATILAGIPVNVTLLFSRQQYRAAAEAYLRGIERRIAKGLDPKVASVASLFISRWDVAANHVLPHPLQNKLGIAVAEQVYRAYWAMQGTPRWLMAHEAGALTQRLLWASTGVKDPTLPDTRYVEQLAAPDTINTMPEKTLLAFADHGSAKQAMTLEGSEADELIAQCREAGIDDEELAERLQVEGAEAFTESWNKLLKGIAGKIAAVVPEPAATH